MKKIILITIITCCVACVQQHKNNNESKYDSFTIEEQDSSNLIEKQSIVDVDSTNLVEAIMGHRFVVQGDFDGDGKQEQLTESFFSSINQTEAVKFYSNTAYEKMVEEVIKLKPKLVLKSNTAQIKDFTITDKYQQFGLAYLKNEGDLDGDQADELSYVVKWADWSNVNSCVILSYKNGSWIRLYSFQIWDFQLPDLPKQQTTYGLMGVKGLSVQQENDSLQETKEEFKGLVEKVDIGKIKITYSNIEEGVVQQKIVELK